MLKQKTVGLDDSNIAHLGGKEEHDARKHAAEGEKAWAEAGKKEGIEIWRIEAMGVHVWPKEKHGQFYAGDSFIVLKTNVDKKSGKMSWDVHFWLGTGSSIDERGVAAYKTVELDDMLGDAPVQHREVEGEESDLFASYFKPALIILQGGVASGFHHAEAAKYAPRLLHIGGGKHPRVTQAATTSASELNHGDVFLLDHGLKFFQWNGKLSNAFEKHKAAEIANHMKADRPKATLVVIDDEPNPEFWTALGGSPSDVKVVTEAIPDDAGKGAPFVKKIYQLSDKTGSIVFNEVPGGALLPGKISKSALKSDDVFFVDIGSKLFVWVGKGSSPAEKKESMVRAESFLSSQGRPSSLPITRVLEGANSSEFDEAFL